MISRELFYLHLKPKTVVGPIGCWLWQGNVHNGYGRISICKTSYRVHRYAYTALVGPIPEGLVLDHLCRNKACCNPEHLEPVTCVENVIRGENANARKTHCPQGHPYSGDNLHLSPRRNRYCKKCMDIHHHEQRKNHCPKGHEFTAESMRVTAKGYRYCLICEAERGRNITLVTGEAAALADACLRERATLSL